jgi:heme/copper-type cytochrome/quinol oxidase subunit 2
MYPTTRIALSLVLGTGLLFAPTAANAETYTYTNMAHLDDVPANTDDAAIKQMAPKQQEFWIVTNEIKTTIQEGGKDKEIEAYRWDPGFIVVDKNKPVTLHFYGVKGKEHPFVIDGLNVKGDVKKGQVTTVTFTPTKAGTYPIICLVHPTVEKNGPMIGYLRVE